MQRFILFILCGLGIYSASAQLSFSHHAYMPGDSIVRQQVVYRDPGSCGRQLSWDFSFLQAAEEPYVITYHIPDSTQLQDLCAIEHRTRYYYYQTEDSLWATGYENPTTYMRYCLPELRLTYPFSYGDTLFSVFSGKGQYGHRVKLSVEGYPHVHADAEGELRLPDGVVRKALRVHTERRYVLIDGDSVHTALHTYSWYADDCRYPVLESIVYEDADTALFRTSFYYYPIERMVGDKETQQDNEEFNPIDAVFAEAEFLPNPIVSNLQINYLLLRSARVRFCLHSMLGLPLYQGTVQEQAAVTLNRFTYDELGRVSKKEVYGNRDNIRYQYNIRDQITQIKSTAFEENLYYTEIPAKWATHTSPMYNGNPAVQTWTHDNKINGYIYQYDTYNRYRGAYSILNNTWSDYYYTESFTYDLQGNIKTLDRWDNQDVMNYLFFTYNGNQVTKITDNGFQPFLYESKRYRDNNNTGNDFQYDANGNLTVDKDRGITQIKYNILNLPDTIIFDNGNRIINRYTAAGEKISTFYHTYPTTVHAPLSNAVGSGASSYSEVGTLYLGPIEYAVNSDYEMRIINPEGMRLFFSAGDNFWVHFVSDHLGNIRESWIYDPYYPSAGSLLQRSQYYPSGLPWNDRYETTFHPYRYNGKEFVEMHGLDEYDSEARYYYPAIMRTTTMDPLCEKYYSTSPYAWCGNNPVRNVDPTGMVFTDAAEKHVGRLIARIDKQQKYNNEHITKLEAQLANNNLNERQIERLNNKISNLRTKNSSLEEVRSEINTLRNSSQVYDIRMDESVNIPGDISGVGGEIRGSTGYDTKTNMVKIRLGSNSISLLAHELKHAYQFEMGEFSVMGPGGLPFYDKTDEIEAYQRGALFGQPFNGRLSSDYDKLREGPLSMRNSYPIVAPNDPRILQHLANESKSIFRWNGTTYISIHL